jgi:hypothetical protein
MKWAIAIGLIPPIVVAAVMLLLVPSSRLNAAVLIAGGFLLVTYVALVTIPAVIARRTGDYVFAGQYSLIIFPYFVTSLLFFILTISFQGITWKWALAVELVITAIGAVLLLGAWIVTRRDEKLGQQTQQAVGNFRSMALNVDLVARSIGDPSLAIEVRKLSEQINMSPQVGTPASAVLDAQVGIAVQSLALVDPNANPDGYRSALKTVSDLLYQRNETVKVTR